MHLEQARQRNARIPEVLNNLAWGLAQKDEPDLERALQLAEAAQRLSNIRRSAIPSARFWPNWEGLGRP